MWHKYHQVFPKSIPPYSQILDWVKVAGRRFTIVAAYGRVRWPRRLTDAERRVRRNDGFGSRAAPRTGYQAYNLFTRSPATDGAFYDLAGGGMRRVLCRIAFVAAASMTIIAKIERTDQGEQLVLPGAERSAR